MSSLTVRAFFFPLNGGFGGGEGADFLGHPDKAGIQNSLHRRRPTWCPLHTSLYHPCAFLYGLLPHRYPFGNTSGIDSSRNILVHLLVTPLLALYRS